MSFFQLLIKKSVSVFLIMSVLVITGIIASNSLPVSFYPDFSVPALFINTAYPGADPESVEQSVTKPIEDAISSVSGIESISSTSQESFSLVQVSFDFGVDTGEKTDEIQKIIDALRNILPQEANLPEIVTINDFVSAPVTIALSSSRKTEGELKLIADKTIAPEISKLTGVGVVTVNGGLDTIVQIEPDKNALIETGISLTQVAMAVRSSNTDFPIGEVKGNNRAFSLRLEGKFRTISDIGDVIVVYNQNNTVFLRDIADISVIEQKQTKFSRVNGESVVTISVRKPAGGNTIEIAENVRQWLNNNKNNYPELEFKIIKDESIVINKAISNVINSLFLGALLATIIIYLILGSFRNTLIIVVSIPVSIVISFIFMKVFNLSINTVSLGGLGMAIGMVVDSSVVVMENSFRILELNSKDLINRNRLIAGATSEVALPITASVLTTVVVFLPMAFTSGLAKVLLGELSLVIVFALITSILVSVTVIPVLNSILLTTDYKPSLPSVWFNLLLDKIKDIYLVLLKKSLRYRFLTLLIFTILMIGGCSLITGIETGMLPDSDQGEFQIQIIFPRGVSVEYTNEKLLEIEKYLSEIGSVNLINSIVGEDVLFGTLRPYSATINVFTDLTRSTREVITEVRAYLENYPGITFNIQIIDASAGISGSDIEYNITGNNIDALSKYGDKFSDLLDTISGVSNIKSNLSSGVDAYIFKPDKKKLAAMGLSVFDISQIIRNAKTGQIVSSMNLNGYDIDIKMILKNADQLSIRELENMPVATMTGVVPLKVFGKFVEGVTPAEIKRIDRIRAVNITADVQSGYSRTDIEKNIEFKLNDFVLPADYKINKKGASRAIAESFQTLGIALLIGIMLVFTIMGVQFNSIKLPFVIILSIPFSMPGAFVALYITGAQLNLPSFLGIIMLAGIVVNNGIILLDFIIANLDDGQTGLTEAILEAGKTRYRPVMMTTLTTILGMLFLALNIGGGGEALEPLAIAVIGGLLYSILVSLILLPVIFTFFSNIKK